MAEAAEAIVKRGPTDLRSIDQEAEKLTRAERLRKLAEAGALTAFHPLILRLIRSATPEEMARVRPCDVPDTLPEPDERMARWGRERARDRLPIPLPGAVGPVR